GSFRAWDVATRHVRPSASDARTALRTAWAVHPTGRPVAAGPSPPARARSTWDRRTVNGSADWRPVPRARRSAAVRERTNVRAVFIRAGYDPARNRQPSAVNLH